MEHIENINSPKRTYRIIHTEELVGWFFVEAGSTEEAMEIYNQKVCDGKIDFSDMEMVDSSDEVDLVSDEVNVVPVV